MSDYPDPDKKNQTLTLEESRAYQLLKVQQQAQAKVQAQKSQNSQNTSNKDKTK